MKPPTLLRSSTLGALALAFTAGMAPLALAQDAPPPPRPDGPRGDFRPPVHPIIAALDTNSDGEISAEEIAAAAQSLKKLDADNDGKLAGDELRPPRGAGVAPGGPPGGFNLVETVMENDADKDGKVTKAELPERMQRMLERLDTNQDGALDRAELEAGAQRFRPRDGQGPRDGAEGNGQDRPRRQQPPQRPGAN